jgi:uncharacterized protein YndB with AHSA1/START domain
MSTDHSQSSPEIVKTIEVNASQTHVFEMFVTRISDWWPLAKFSRSRGTQVRSAHIEPIAGGLIYEVTETGERLEWGRVRSIEAPKRIVMEWHLGRPVSTEVEVIFEPLAPRLTRVRLVHRGWEKLEAVGATVERQGYENGWTLIFQTLFFDYVNTTNGDQTR